MLHLKALLAVGALLGGAAYAIKRSKGMPAPPVAPVIPAPTPVAPPAAPPSPTAPATPTTVVGSLVSAVTSLGGGVTSSLSSGIDTLTGGMIGQDITGQAAPTLGGSIGDTSVNTATVPDVTDTGAADATGADLVSSIASDFGLSSLLGDTSL